MSFQEGSSRLSKIISLVGWMALILSVIFYFAGGAREFWLIVGTGAFIFAVFQAVVWVFDGFTGKGAESGNLLWPLKRRKLSSNNNAVISNKPQKSVSGVGGWLMFFVISLMVLSPARAILETAVNLKDAERLYPTIVNVAEWVNYKMSIWAALLAVSSLMVWAGWNLLKVHVPSSVRNAIIVIWISSLLLQGADAYLSWLFFDIGPAEFLGPEMIGPLLGSLAYAFIWTWYLKVSVRVTNTYFRGEEAGSATTSLERREPSI